MNTKQVLHDALQGQLETKKQAYETFKDTVTTPAYKALKSDMISFMSSFASLEDFQFEYDNNGFTIRHNDDSGWYDRIEINLTSNWKSENKKWIEIKWNSNNYSLDKPNTLALVNALHSLVHNTKLLEDKWINEWDVKYREIYKADNEVREDYTNLQNALNTLKYEIQNDCKETMKQIGFEIKSFKPHHNFEWNYNENNERVYKVSVNSKMINMQYGRSQYDTLYVNGFKVLGKKGNKYKVEIYREGSVPRTYDVLEKKFDSFIENVVDWENKEADYKKTKAEQSLAERTGK